MGSIEMIVTRLVLAVAIVAVATPAWPCTTIIRPTPEQLVSNASVILRVLAESLSARPGQRDGFRGSATQVRFVVIERLKGEFPAQTIEFNGALETRNDPNDHQAPYRFVRPGGRSGNCYAFNYRAGAEYLLLLRRAPWSSQPRLLTPYWSAVAPTNEQLRESGADPWLKWVRDTLEAMPPPAR